MQGKQINWVYPPDKWVSNFNKTFVYGWTNPKAKLFISIGTKQKEIKVYPNGNFAQVINLPNKKNIVNLIQILDGKKKIISRKIVVKTLVEICRGKSLQSKPKQSQNGYCHSEPKAKNPDSVIRSFAYAQDDITIVIDPGHGGKEHGTHSPKGIPEKVFNLQIAKLLYKSLYRGLPWQASTVNVYLTRSKDKFVSLKQRVNFAKKKKCNLLISIHHNALPDNENPLKHKGVGIYYTHDFVKPFAKSLLESISRESKLPKYGIFKRDFAVTRPDSYAGILIECGFLIHPEESEVLIKKSTQEKIVGGIINVIVADC